MSEGRGDHFPTTQWTLVARLKSSDAATAHRALDELVGQYRYSLYAYIRRRGFSHHDAEDSLHDFLLKLLQSRLLESADAARGRLRGFLGTVLGNFLQNWRRSQARHGPPDAESSVAEAATDAGRYERERFTEDDTPEKVFDRKWGHALMARVIERLRTQCGEQGKGAIFTALQPVLATGGSMRGHDTAAIAATLGMSEGALRITLMRHMHEYRTILEDEVFQTVERPEDVQDEIAHLMSVFAKD